MARSRGQVIPKGKSKWLVRFYAGRDGEGKKLYPSEIVEGSKTDAEKALTRLLAKRDTASFVKPNQLTVESFSKDFLEIKHDVAKTTHAQYKERLESDVLKFLGKKKLTAVHPQDVQKFVQWMKETRKLSPRTIRYSVTVLGMLFSEAMRLHLVATNPVQGVKLPKKTHQELEVLTVPDMGTLLDKARENEDPLYPLWDLLLNSGLRPQEALALTVSDLDGVKLRISKALSDGEVSSTKTARSRRTITLPRTTADLLREHMRRNGIIGGLVFPTELGTHLDLSNVRKRWFKALKRAGLKPRKLYSTRHSHATALLSAGVALKVVSERLGHASIAITADVYSHVLPEIESQAAEAVTIPTTRKVGT